MFQIKDDGYRERVSTAEMRYLSGYPDEVKSKVQQLIDSNRLAELLLQKYDCSHTVRTDKALYQYVAEVKNTRLRGADAIDKVAFDSNIQVLKHALGTHMAISRVQGGKLKAKREIRIASLFKEVPLEFLTMIVAHELAHTRHRNHDRAFYQLCCHIAPDYHQAEFDLRLYMTHLDLSGRKLWQSHPP